jgi:acetolactate synthase-1/3 small subunit
MKHIIAVLLENEPGALSRVVTIVTAGSDEVIEQITKHLNRLIEVVKVVDLTEGAYTERELMMVKVRAVGKEREEMMRMAEIFRGRIIDVTDKSYTIELTGDHSKNDAFLEALDRGAILETVRTGASGIGRGERILRV